ncbi:MAG: hypothetical protein A2499_01695 [Stygiobacter sp. RIFOXYC12_FULL_38_8]|nr:MAG: hypothetical protein A2X62_11205 [Stygiobacter sp. GWC2_38_9]OGU77662.1 MAG: hypothetical protein A2279_01330 [Stygiobacter sp. RIFOXYA12_FULL_38_9]OGV09581.1 MAG: hypothetical protein A2299_00575 [Stygiobacter sp. RIFOXYB2_FULL_37_11]OGV15147.1 MAG: hypothetical protein A2237_08965 [Stygiobacter sp. RIFOXYA2_FULL_38_8]OGV16711.1 MAG: hypothetical protein A2440_05045 [Stygiobacter sp. RIFOXYC2_FULL_38_25]OGV24882.1 MAG: hypothetical protein A2499_01695 [Stygiobacter sp. RIFOXYC12_FULL_
MIFSGLIPVETRSPDETEMKPVFYVNLKQIILLNLIHTTGYYFSKIMEKVIFQKSMRKFVRR